MMIRSEAKLATGLITIIVLATGLTAWAASGQEEILNQLVQKYMEQRFGESVKYFAAADPKIDKVNVDLKKGVLNAKSEGSFKLLGRRYKAKYNTTWKDKNNCAYVTDIGFSTELNATVSTIAEQAMRAMYVNKCEKDEKVANAIRAAWLVKGLAP